MRIVTYRSERGDRAGVLRDDRVTDAWDALAGAGETRWVGPASVRGLLEAELLENLARRLGQVDDEESLPVDDVSLRPPIPDPEKIICMGLNYRAHAQEAGLEPPEQPTFFAKFRNALTAPGAEVALPEASEKVDFEAEVAFVIGRRCRQVAAAEALDFVAGYTLLNDLSARDLQFATPQWMPGKVFDGAAPCGPALVTPDEAGPPDAIEISLALNGEKMQQASTDDLVFAVPELVAHLSTLMTLEPGDIIATGTPAGVGSVRQPRVWLRPGDEVVIASPTLGRLETRIAG
jgi:2-keto-4-pentenoate hydratase/2-oxohepta-3-ene-1,7-dioic acid hydratase in catechol pathway